MIEILKMGLTLKILMIIILKVLVMIILNFERYFV